MALPRDVQQEWQWASGCFSIADTLAVVEGKKDSKICGLSSKTLEMPLTEVQKVQMKGHFGGSIRNGV